MNKTLNYIATKDFGLYQSIRQKAWDTCSDMYPIFCVCGQLCTGLHETYCSRFQARVDSLTMQIMKDEHPDLVKEARAGDEDRGD